MTYEDIRQYYHHMDYTFFTGAYNLNLYGRRNPSLEVNEWNDVLGVAYEDEFGNRINLEHAGTTKPGLYWLKNKMGNINGTAILVPGQYRSCWKIGKHKGYLAMQQYGNAFKVWRDNDSDGQFDYRGKIWEDVGGLNMHTESFLTKVEKVGAYSAGCQVRAHDREHFMVMALAERSAEIYGDIFSYTLFG